MMLIGAGNLWAEDVTADVVLSSGTFSTDHITWTIGDAITIQQLKGNSATNVNSSYISKPRIYKGHILAFEAATGYVIKSISIKCDGSYSGNSMTAGTSISSDLVVDNTTDVNRVWTTTAGGTHVVSSSSSSGLSVIYIQNVSSSSNVQLRPEKITITYGSSGDNSTCATPTFSPAAGAVLSGTEVSINCSTSGATIYYTTDGTTPTSSSDVYSDPIEITEATTIKAYAVKADLDDSEIATAEYTIREFGGNIDFESALEEYVDWTFENVGNTNTDITAHGGDKYGANINATGNGVATLKIQTKEKVALPNELTCYVSKVSGNTTSSTWTISVSEDGTNWTEINNHAAASMSKGVWQEFKANLSSYNDVYIRITYGSSTAIRAIDDISLTMRDANTKVTPTIVIDATSLTNDLAGENNVSAGTVTAAVMDGQTAVENVSVTWSSSNTDVATIDATTGAVTLIATGTTTLTATFAGNDNYNEASGTYELTVIDSNAAGGANNPYTVAQARAAIDANTGITGVYATGIVSEIVTAYNSQYGNISYNISTDGTTTADQLQAYRGKSYNGDNFTSADDIQVGDVVVVYGDLKKYTKDGVDTYEFDANNRLVSLDRKEVKFYLAGSWGENDYGWGEGMEQLTKSGNTYTLSKNLTNGTLFQIVKVDETNNNTTTWYGGLTDDTNSNNPYGIHSGWYENIPLTISQDNLYVKNFKINGDCDDRFTFTVDATDPDDLKLTVTGWHVPVTKYYLAGSWTDGWSLSGMVELTEHDGLYTGSKNFEGNTLFKFVKTVDGNITEWYGPTSSGNYGVHSGHCTDIALSNNSGDSNFIIEPQGSYSFSLDIEGMKFSVGGWPITADGNMFVKVTSGDVEDGAYLIVYEDGNLAFDGSLTTSTSTALSGSGNHIAVDIVNNAIVADATTKASLFYIQGNTIKSASGYYIGQTANDNGLLASEGIAYTNTISIDNNGDAVINSSGNAYLRYNTQSSGMFRYYKSGTYTAQKAIQLYKLVTLPMNDIVITSAEWATYVPNLAVTIPEDVTAYIVTNATSTSVTLSSVASAPANTGLVVNGAQGTYTPTAAETTDDVLGNQLVVSDGTVKGDGATIYALGNKGGTVGFKRVANDVTVPAGKPYLTIESSGSKDFFDFSFDEGVATGIESIESIGFDMNAPVYDLQGRQVNRLHKGIFIQNGKKIIVK